MDWGIGFPENDQKPTMLAIFQSPDVWNQISVHTLDLKRIERLVFQKWSETTNFSNFQ